MNKNLIPVSFPNLTTPIPSLIDSGADLSCCSKAHFHRLGYTMKDLHKPDIQYIKGAGGGIRTILGQISIPLKIADVKLLHRFYIIEQLNYSCILGFDFLHQNKVKISYEDNTVTINHQDRQVEINMISEPNSKARLRENCTIPAGTIRTVEIHVPCSSDRPDKFLILTPSSKLNDLQICMLECMVAPVHNKAWIQIANFTSEPIQIYKRTPIANIEFIKATDFSQVQRNAAKTANVCYLDKTNADMMPLTSDTPNSVTKPPQELSFDLSSSNLTCNEKERLMALLHEYSDCFSNSLSDIGKTSLLSSTIETKDEIPVRSRPYKTSPEMKAAIEEKVQELLDSDIIEYSNSNYSSPMLLVKKPNGTYRLVVDYRKLNEKIKDVAFPLPLISDIVDQIGTNKSKYFSTLDLSNSFFQIRLIPSARHKSAFICHHGLFQFKRMPMGLKSSSFVQQLLVNEVFKGLSWHILLCYVDDIMIHSPTFEQHLEHLRLVFERLRAAHLTLSSKKCAFARPSVQFLGNVFTKDGTYPSKSKTAAIDSLPPPKSQKEVKRFLGVTGYYRRYIPSYSKIAYPLFKLLSKQYNKKDGTTKFQWSPEADAAFRHLKQALVQEPILLKYPNNDKPMVLRTDGSQEAVSYALMQEGDDGLLHPICYGGKSLRKEQRNWPILHIELYAILLGIREYRCYLLSKPFKVITDCRSLQYLKNMALTSGKLARWNIELMQYNFTIEYQSASSNLLLDMLSRRPYDQDEQDHDVQGDSERDVLLLFEEPNHQNEQNTCSRSVNHTHPATQTQSINAIDCPDVSNQDQLQAESNECNTENKQIQTTISPGELTCEANHISQVNSSIACDSNNIPSDIPEIMLVQPVGNNTNRHLNIGKLQQDCTELGSLYNYLSRNQLPQNLSDARRIVAESPQYHLLNNKLYHIYQNRTRHKISVDPLIHQLVVPKCLRQDLLYAYHDSPAGGCHLGFQRVYQTLRTKYYWKGMYEYAYNYIMSCQTCQEMKRDTNKRNVPLKPLNIEPIFAKWHLDYLGGLPETESGNKYILLCVESFSHICEAIPMKSQSSSAVARAIYDNIISRWGLFSELHCDNDSVFGSKLIKTLCDMFQIRKATISTYHPQSNSSVERMNSVVLQCLRTLCAKCPTKWDTYLSSVMMAYRMSPSLNSTGFSPFYMVTGTQMRADIDYVLDNIPQATGCVFQYVEDMVKKLQLVRKLAKHNMERQQRINKRRHDMNSRIPPFRVGQRVYLSVEKVPAKASRKLYNRYSGPYYIMYRSPNHSYKLRNCGTNKVLKYPVHASRLKAYRDPRNYRSDDPSPLDQLEREFDQQNLENAQDGEPDEPAHTQVGNDQDDQATGQLDARPITPPVQNRPQTNYQPKQGARVQLQGKTNPNTQDLSHTPLPPDGQTESRTRPPEQGTKQVQKRTQNIPKSSTYKHVQLDPPKDGQQIKQFPGKSTHDKSCKQHDELQSNEIPGTSQSADAQPKSSRQNETNTQNKPLNRTPKEKNNTWYPVERLLKSKLIRGIRHYLVRWADKTSKPSWEPVINITPSLIEQFHINKYNTSRRKGKKR